MYRYRHLVVAGVAQGVVLMRRDQAPCGAAVAMHGVLRRETEALAVALQQRMRGDDQSTLPDALYAPHGIVIMQRRALPRAPAHGDHAVAERAAAMQFAACVMPVQRLAYARRQRDPR